MIQNKNQLRFKYETLLWLNKIKNENEDCIIDLAVNKIKKEIRDYYKKKEKERKEWLIKDDGMDGYIILFELPSEINSIQIDSFELAKEYFEAYEYRRCRPSMYDCTGQSFTIWYKIIKRNNKFYAYHRIGFDF